MDYDIKADVLKGLPEIANFINESRMTTFRLLTAGAIPAVKVKNRWRASKKKLMEHYRKQMGFE